MELTIKAINRLSTMNDVKQIKGTKNIQANGYSFITGRTIPIDQLSSVMI